ncbi:Uncharacterised protein [Algoriella xinjiangensis]|uniref:hypothetical protein n=1 Tax=Algoriella xinjiangensis TaxID=684065 RepID=UPI000F63117C|nr:hypothetical protein [Algoriella xinjiangensis]VDH16875.1 Uncharacterised protein [Algoriella xinjiangensis]
MGKSNKNETPEVVKTSGVDTLKETVQEVIKSPIELANEELKAENEKLKAENKKLQVALKEYKETAELLQADLDELSVIPQAQDLLSGVNPLGSIEEYEGQIVYVTSNGDRYMMTSEVPERFNFHGKNKTKVEWSQDIEAMAALVKSRSNFVELIK